MGKYVYPSLKSRIKTEYKIYLLALLFIVIADSIGKIEIPLGPGKFILFPIFIPDFRNFIRSAGDKDYEIPAGKGCVKTCYCSYLSFYCKAWY